MENICRELDDEDSGNRKTATGKMAQGFRMTNEQWDYVYRCFEIMNLEVLAYTFSADGVLKRGS